MYFLKCFTGFTYRIAKHLVVVLVVCVWKTSWDSQLRSSRSVQWGELITNVFPFKTYLKLDFVFQQSCPACPIRHFSQCQTSEGPRRHSKEKSYVDAFNNKAQHSSEEEDGMGTKNLTKQGMKTSSRILSPTMISLDT